jgi:hypothetical protein
MSESGIEVTACETQQRKFQYHHNIEVSQENLEYIGEDTEKGDLVAVRNVENDGSAACYGRIDICEEFDNDQAGVGYTLRYAIGAPDGESVRIEPVDLPERGLIARISDRLFGVRRVICRVRMAVEPDPGFRVCRVTEETRELLGIDEGDHVVVESVSGRARDIKSLPLSGNTEEYKNQQKRDNEERYPSCFELLDIEGVRGTQTDVPPVYIDRDLRQELQIRNEDAEEPNSIDEGLCKPVVVYRDTTNLFGRIFLDIATPLIIAAAAAVIGLDTATIQSAVGASLKTILWAKVGLISVAILIALFAVWYRMRISLLD